MSESAAKPEKQRPRPQDVDILSSPFFLGLDSERQQRIVEGVMRVGAGP